MFKRLVPTLAVLLLLTGCGGAKSMSSQVALTVYPTQPIVFTSPVTLPNGTTIMPPWFSFQLGVNNNTTGTTGDAYSSVTIEAVSVIVTGPGAGGAIMTQTTQFNPSINNQVNADFQCNYVDFGQFDRGGTTLANLLATNMNIKFPASGVNGDKLFSLPDLQTGACPIAGSTFYVSIQGAPTGTMTQVYNYSVQIQPIGWFGNRLSQQQRFQNAVFVTTQ